MSESPELACPIKKNMEGEIFKNATSRVENVTTINTVSSPN
jgi:hypothetical protein